jgi:hypothetical protein
MSTLRDQFEVGAARVAPGGAPLGLAVPHDDQMVDQLSLASYASRAIVSRASPSS